MISFKIQNCIGYAANSDGTYRLDFNDGSSRLATESEVLSAKKEEKILNLKLACKNAIESGFYCSTLGSAHLYDSALPQDQINLIGAKQAGIGMYFTCTDQSGLKWQQFHTAVQIGDVYLAGMEHIQANKNTLYAKLAALNSATTLAEIEAVTW